MIQPKPHSESIAIVGMAGKFPGARNVAEFWENLIAGRDSVTKFSDEQLASAGYDPAAVRKLPGWVGARGIVEKPEWFDRAFFNIPPKEAEAMDPQHRLFLEIAWDALEDAGCDPSRQPGLTGVFAGMSNNTYYSYFVQKRRDLLDAVGVVTAVISNEKDFLATRLAYKLNLHGPAVSVQTACSTSLVAVCVACRSLANRECDTAIAGGVALTFPQERGYFSQDGGMTSPDGRCAPFDAQANGTVFSNGAGVIVLKRLSDALENGDQIYAVIRGHGINNDGSKKPSFAAPSDAGHSEVIAQALENAGVTADTVGYIEAHGTATSLGDPVEIAGLSRVFRAATDARQICALGSVKGNIGHMDAASGIGSLIKVALALRNETLPPTIHCDTPNPALHLDESPFFLNTEKRAWARGQQPRRAGVSSFGIGGTNAHVILEEAPLLPATTDTQHAQVLVISAKSAAALDKRAEELAKHLEKNPVLALADVAFTLHSGRQAFQHRRAVIARSVTEAVTGLRAPAKLHRTDERTDSPCVLLFPGQGSQYPGMGVRLHEREPVFRAALDECSALLKPHLGIEIRDLIFSTDENSAASLRETRYTQPAIFAIDYALGKLWLSLGLKPAALVGHSVGEFAAAALAGVFSLADAARLVAIRADLVHKLPGGAMLAARLTAQEAREFLADSRLALAAVNSPRLCVISGPHEAVAELEAALAMRNVVARRLATSHAFHSPMVESVVVPFAEAVKSVKLHAPALPVISCVTGKPLTADEAMNPDYWAHHLRATVRFADAVGHVLDDKCAVLIECGPGQGLSQLARQHQSRTAKHEILHIISEEIGDDESFATAIAKAWMAGVKLDWRAVHHGQSRRRVSLPGYPFERQRYFADLPPGMPMPLAIAGTDGDAPVETAAPCTTSTREVQPEEAPALESAVAKQPAAPPTDLLGEIHHLLSDLSGIDLASAPAGTAFLELGLDSLLLSQAALGISRKFGVKITFRQLLQETPTPELLAAHIAANRKTQPAIAPPAPAQPTSPAATPAAKPAAAATAHGPFRPPQREALGLTDAQQRWLSDFIRAYNARTKNSKDYAQLHRAHMADPRTVSGFRREWKEIVYPVVVERSSGSKLWDIDGNEWLDMTLSFGAAMLGHQPKFVTDAITEQLACGMEIGPTSPLAGEVAKLICELTGSERAIFCNTGSEAVTGAVRAARTVTGRTKVVYFHESYHGIDNEVLGRRTASASAPISPGITDEAVSDTIILDYGDPRSLDAISARASEIAAVLVEPVQSRRPALQPAEFLRLLRDITQRHEIALIFDEVITGFRCHQGGAQAHFGIRADMATYGKVIGGGLPIGVIAGRAEYMDSFDGGQWSFGDDSIPTAAVTFFAGTFIRHPLVLAAARAVLLYMKEQGNALQAGLAKRTGGMIGKINAVLTGTPFTAECFGSNWLVQTRPDFRFSGLLYALLRHHGLHIWEGRPCFVSAEHSDTDIAKVIAAFESAIRALEGAGFFSRTEAGSEKSAPEPATIPLTESQRELWLVCQQSPAANSACNETWTLHLEGPLDAAALRSAVQIIVDRHDALRSSFTPSGDTLRIADSIAIQIPSTDLSTLPESEREACLFALRRTESVRVFDLKVAPLLALHLVRLAPDNHALIFNAHHIVCDGWSCDIFLRELAALYSARTGGNDPQLATAMQMREYEAWERARTTTPEFAADAAHWLAQYRTIPPLLDLPGDRPHPRQRSYRGASETAVLPTEFAQQLTRTGSANGSTLFTVLLAGFKTLLYRLSGTADLAVGIPSAGQNLAGGESLVGHCVNMLPVRTQLEGSQTFTELMKIVQGGVLEAFEHQQVTFGWLLQQIQFQREPGRVPLIPVIFNLDPALTQVRFNGLRHRIESNPRSAYQFDLGFNCDVSAAGLRIVCNYNTDIFDAATVRRWLGHYRVLLEAAAQNPAACLDMLPLLTDGERSEIVTAGTATQQHAPHACIHAMFERFAACTPDAVALSCEGKSLTYGELDRAANRLARHLISRGVKPSSLIAVCLDRSPELMIAILAVLKAGGAYVPLDPDSPGARLELILSDARPGALITQEKLLSKAGTFAGVTFRMDSDWQIVAALDGTAPGAAVAPDSPAYVIYTSGSTGVPKGVVVTHYNVQRLFDATREWFLFDANDVWTLFHSAAFDFSVWEMWGALCHGGRLVIVPYLVSRNPARFYELLAQEKVTVLNQTPLAFQQLIHVENAPDARRELALRLVVFGGEALDFEALRPWFERHGDTKPQLVNMYGITETTVHVTYRPVSLADLSENKGSRIGRAIPDLDLFVLDGSLAPCAIGVAGELHVGGAGVASGYLGQPELTASRFIPHPWKNGAALYKSGDLARRTADGDIEYLGRCDMQVKIRGFRIELGEIESALLRNPAIQQAAVLAQPGEGGENRLVAYIVGTPGTQPDERGVRAALRQLLPGYMIPTDIVWLDALPMNQNGKLDTKSLPDAKFAAATDAASPPENQIQADLVRIWEELLNRKPIGIRDSFFELGGHSLMAVRLFARIAEKWNVELSLQRIFECPTVAELATTIESTPARKDSQAGAATIAVARRQRRGTS